MKICVITDSRKLQKSILYKEKTIVVILKK
ncbi:MAG: hypothetical protein PWQ27_416 [Kosmotoga sp.]|nr:hypothetical protein [Kosmotoga sp.]